MIRIPRLAFGLCVAGAASTLPAYANDDRFILRLSAFNPEATLGFDAAGTVTDGTDTATFDDGAEFDLGRKWRPRGSIGVRLSERQRLIGNFYDYERSRGRTFGGGDFDPGDLPGGPGLPGDPVEIPEVAADARFEFALANLNYEFAAVDTPTFQWGVGLGVTHARLETRLDVASTATDEFDAESASLRWKRSEWSPGLHTRLAWAPNERWHLSLEGQYLDARWGDFLEEKGHFERGGLLAEYRITERVGVHVGYDWFRLKLADDFDGSLETGDVPDVDRLDYAGRLTGRLKVHGPLAGMTIRF
ncbi:hypothetical protein [Luteimonas sp. R10]|uniref:hypothetical protein n=1 Tax=Luteimonas sp. R10 TaxID=3108176 RepID=UPI00308A95FC|nr:hypothetical protein U3649_05520 [Luteimonas sp. R10]